MPPHISRPILSQFHSVFKVKPAAIFTDGDVAMHSAIKRLSEKKGDVRADGSIAPCDGIWHGIRHLLCIFHLWKNMYTNIHPMFVQQIDKWREAANMWWKICKQTDVHSIDSFDAEWAELVAFVKSFGIHSTQRAEAVHSAIKRFLNASTLLTEMVQRLVEYNDESKERKDSW